MPKKASVATAIAALALLGQLAAQPAQAATKPAVTCSYTLNDPNGWGLVDAVLVTASQPVTGPFRVTLLANPSLFQVHKLTGNGQTTGATILGHNGFPKLVTSAQIAVTIKSGKVACAYNAAGSNPA